MSRDSTTRECLTRVRDARVLRQPLEQVLLDSFTLPLHEDERVHVVTGSGACGHERDVVASLSADKLRLSGALRHDNTPALVEACSREASFVAAPDELRLHVVLLDDVEGEVVELVKRLACQSLDSRAR